MTPPNELQLAVARAEGWTFCDQEAKCCHGSAEVPWGSGVRVSGKKWIYPDGSYLSPWHRTAEEATEWMMKHGAPKLPDYLNDANAAHALIERLKGEGWACDVHIQNKPPHYSCSFFSEPSFLFWAEAETFCTAVAKAYLAVRGVRVEE